MGNHLVEVKVWGKYACFTRPENKVERLSYPIITPSAAVGVLESIYWKPEFRWQVTEIGVLSHPDRSGALDWENYLPITLNELADEGTRHPMDGYNIENHRVQRTCQILRWPCYRIHARAKILSSSTNPEAIRRQFSDRVKCGQCHQQPYLGLREFTAFFEQPNGDDVPPKALTFPNLGRIFHSAVLPSRSQRVQYRFISLALDRGWFKIGEGSGA